MKIQQHPRMKDITIGDEVLRYGLQLYAQVVEVFPAAVCVKLVTFQAKQMRLEVRPQLWRAEEIENLSVCRYCGGREALAVEYAGGIPYRACRTCQSVLDPTLSSTTLKSSDVRPRTDHRPQATDH